METRTMYALLAAALLVPLGSAVAQEPTDATAPAPKPTVTYKIGMMPAEQWGAPGSTVTYRIVVEARNATTVHLAVHAPELLAATLSSEDITAAPGAPGSASLTVVSRENTSAQKLPIVIIAKSESGETRETRATLILREKPTEAARPHEPKPYANEARPDAQPKPMAAERPHERGDRADELEHRLEMLIIRAERYLAKLEASEKTRPMLRPAEPAHPMPGPVANVTLRLSDANVTLGNEGRRVALLIENGPQEGRVPLALRFDDGSGWKVALEKDGVKLHPHERTYVWIAFHPSAAGSVSYSVTAGDGASVQGVAHFPGPSIA